MVGRPGAQAPTDPMVSWNSMVPVPDTVSKTAFRLEYGRAGMCLDLLASCMRLLVFLGSLLKAPDWSAAAATLSSDSPGLVRLAMQISILLVYAVLGQERYILFRGPFSIVHRVLYALGVATAARPGDCKYCHLYWHHRLLFTNTIAVLCRTPATAYWCGSVLCCLIQMVLQLADPQQNCARDLGCAATAVITRVSKPTILLQKLQEPQIAAAGAVSTLELVVPGLLLTYLEVRARRRWWATRQHQQLQQCCEVAASAAAQCSNRLCEASGLETSAGGYQQLCSNQQQQSECRTDVNIPKQHCRALGNSQQQRSSNLEQTRPAGSQQQREEAATEVAIRQLAAAAAESIIQHGRPGATSSSSSCAAAAAATATAELGCNDVALAASSFSGPRVTGGSLNPSPSLYGSHSMAPLGAEGATHGALYVSPLKHQEMSFKFNSPLDTSPELFAQFKSELTALVHKHHATSGDPRPLVTNFSAFPGCYHVVISAAVFPNTLASDICAQQQQQQGRSPAVEQPLHQLLLPVSNAAAKDLQQQQLEQQVKYCLQGWPGWSLLSLKMQTLPPSSAAAAGGVAAVIQPLVITWPVTEAGQSQKTDTKCDSSSTSRNSSNSGNGLFCQASEGSGVCVRVEVDGAVLAQLEDIVRVVALLQESGRIVVDRAWQLNGVTVVCTTAAAAAAVLSYTAEDAALQFKVGLQQLGASAEHSLEQQQQHLGRVLSVMVLAEKVAQHDTASRRCRSNSPSGHSEQQHAPSVLIAQLPMLLLWPAAAAAELQRLFIASVQAGLPVEQARLDMQALVRDLAAVLYAARSPGTAAPAQDLLLQALHTALAEAFDSYGMPACLGLVQQQMQHSREMSCANLSAAAAAATNGEAAEADSPAGACGTSQNQTRPDRVSYSAGELWGPPRASTDCGSKGKCGLGGSSNRIGGRVPIWVDRCGLCWTAARL